MGVEALARTVSVRGKIPRPRVLFRGVWVFRSSGVWGFLLFLRVWEVLGV